MGVRSKVGYVFVWVFWLWKNEEKCLGDCDMWVRCLLYIFLLLGIYIKLFVVGMFMYLKWLLIIFNVFILSCLEFVFKFGDLSLLELIRR